jgi:hypothetical protein
LSRITHMFGYYFRLGLRSLKRSVILTALMVAAIGVGIGACMTALTVFRAMSGDPIPQKSSQLRSHESLRHVLVLRSYISSSFEVPLRAVSHARSPAVIHDFQNRLRNQHIFWTILLTGECHRLDLA